MKRIRRFNGEIYFDDGPGTPTREDVSCLFFSDYYGREWAEVVDTKYDGGAIKIIVKPPEKTLLQAVSEHFRQAWPQLWAGAVPTTDTGRYVAEIIDRLAKANTIEAPTRELVDAVRAFCGDWMDRDLTKEERNQAAAAALHDAYHKCKGLL